jgi:hypothetical protein
MSARARSILFVLAAAVLFALPLIPEILGTRRLVFRDAQITHWPWRQTAMEAWRERRVPFINPASSGGQPLLANPNAVLLYPTLLLELVLPPASAFNLHYLVHVLWALLGARALSRRLGLSRGAAFAAGTAFAFSGMVLSYASAFANSSAAAAWLPWCAAAVLDLARADGRRASIRAAAAAALAFALQLLAGEPAISALTLLFSAVLAAGVLAGQAGHRGARFFLRFAAGGAISAVAAAAFSAPLLLPLSAVLSLTYRGQHLYSERAFGASPFQFWRLVEWFFPRFAGDPGVFGPGAHWQYAFHRGEVLYIWCVTLGVLPLAAILMASLRRDFWDRRSAGLAAGAAVSLLFAFGSALPLYRVLFFVEALRRLRYPIKFYLLTTLCVALLFGLAWEGLSRRRAGRREAAVLGALALLYLAAAAAMREGGLVDAAIRPWLASLKGPSDALLAAIRGSLRGDALLGLAALAVAALLLFLPGRTVTARDGYWAGLATILLALPAGLPLFVSGDEKTLERPPALAATIAGTGRLYVSPSLPEFSVLLSGTAHRQLPGRVGAFARVQIEELIPQTGSPFHVRYAFDADPDGSYGWYNRIAGEVLTASKPEDKCRLLLAFGTRWVLEDEPRSLPCGTSRTGIVVAGRRLVVSELSGAAPELRWAGRAHERASLSGTLELVRSERFRPETDVVLPGHSDRNASADAASASLSATRVEADRASANVDADGRGHLVFARTFFNTWLAKLDGAPVAPLVADGRDLAVAVPKGRHHVEIEYDRAPFTRGVWLQLAAFVALGTGVIAAGAKR